jgi:mannonate dehydratase
MFLIEFLPPRPAPLWPLAVQMGIRHCVVKTDPRWTRLPPPSEIDTLRTIQRELADAGITLIGLEGDPIDMTRIKLGLPGRDDDIASYQAMLRNMGELGLRLLCYNFMAGIGWHRSNAEVRGRGGALVSQLDVAGMPTTETEHGEISAERIWENYIYFLRAILPVAEQARIRLGAHPDDPPVPSLRGLGRIFHSPEQFQRVLDLSPSRTHVLPGELEADGRPGLRRNAAPSRRKRAPLHRHRPRALRASARRGRFAHLFHGDVSR